MKDYTKYNFAAIAGMKVEITTKSGETIRGTLIDFNFNLVKAPVYIHESGAHVAEIPLAEIESLIAKIKVEDMSVKQVKRLVEDDGFDTLLFQKLSFVEREYVGDNKLSLSCFIKDYDTCIDCTEWGWEK